MRILANYGYRNNGDSYSVTFETVGDVPKDQADSTVDDLFRMAKAAIERQVNPQANPASKEEIVVPEPKKNGNGKIPKDPNASITKKQRDFIIKLAKQKGSFVENLNELSIQEASQVISELMAV